MVSTLRGMRKYSTERASAKEFGGMMQTSPLNSTSDRGSKCFGSTMVLFTLVKIRNSFAHLPVRKRLDHFVLQRHAPDPAVWLDGHPFLLKCHCKFLLNSAVNSR